MQRRQSFTHSSGTIYTFPFCLYLSRLYLNEIAVQNSTFDMHEALYSWVMHAPIVRRKLVFFGRFLLLSLLPISCRLHAHSGTLCIWNYGCRTDNNRNDFCQITTVLSWNLSYTESWLVKYIIVVPLLSGNHWYNPVIIAGYATLFTHYFGFYCAGLSFCTYAIPCWCDLRFFALAKTYGLRGNSSCRFRFGRVQSTTRQSQRRCFFVTIRI